MLKNILRAKLTERKQNCDKTFTYSKFMQKSLNITIIFLFCFSGGMLFEQNLGAESQGRKIQSYVKNGAVLQARKREVRILEQKKKGRKVKYYVLKKSVLQGRKSIAKMSANKMLETGLVTSKMVKNNRWFVKKPFQSSYKKVNIVSKYTPLKVNPEVSDKISREALQMSKTRARITGPVKPGILYSEDSSRGVLEMTKTRARITGPVKPDILYSEESSRGVLEMTKTRARITGPVKPDIIYSKKVSREAMEMTLKRSQKAVSAGKIVSAGKGIVYSAKTLIKMSKRPTIVYAPFKSKKSGEKKKTDVGKN
jgi:hypothetical protein